jgi:hypothetical protein
MNWDDPILWDDPITWDAITIDSTPLISAQATASRTFYAQVLADPELYSDQDVYHATIRHHHRVGAWVQILDENEQVMWEISDVTDGGVSFDITQTPERSLDVTVLDIGGRMLSGAPWEEAAEARRFVRAVIGKETSRGWLRFPMFTGPLSSGGISRQGAEVGIRAEGKESLYLEPYTLWEAFHAPKKTKVVDAIHDLAYQQGERRFRLPELSTRLHKRLSIPRFEEPWPRIQRLAAGTGHIAYFDPEGFLSLRPATPRTVAYVFDDDVVLTPPEVADDYTTLVNVASASGPDPDGPMGPLRVSQSLPPGNPFSPHGMARHDTPRRAIATDEVSWDWKFPKDADTDAEKKKWILSVEARKTDDLKDRAKSMLRVPQKQVSFDCLPVPHLRPGMLCRVIGDYEDQPIDERFVLRSGFFPLTVASPMTVGTWKPVLANWRATHPRKGGR